MNDILQKINSSRLKKIVQSLYNQEHHKIPQQVKIGVIFWVLDYSVWSIVEKIVSHKQGTGIKHLKKRIVEARTNISQETIRKYTN